MSAVVQRPRFLPHTEETLYYQVTAVFFILLLFVFSRAVLPLFVLGPSLMEARDASTLSLKMVDLFLAVIAFLLIARKGASIIYALWRTRVLALFGVYVVLSAFFANDVPQAFLRGSEFLFSILAGALIGTTCRFHTYYKVLLYLFGVQLVLSYLFIFLLPTYGYHPTDAGLWRGVFMNKNHLGLMMGLSTLSFFLYAVYARGVIRLFCSMAGFLSALLLYQSGSVTFMFTTILMFLGFFAWALMNKRMIAAFYLLALMTILGSFMVFTVGFFYEDLLIAVGKDPTLTGRLIYAKLVFQRIAESPFFGTHGIDMLMGGWDIYRGELRYYEALRSHSGLVNSFFYYGAAGFMLLLGVIYAAFISAYSFAKMVGIAPAYFPLGYGIYFFVSSISEGLSDGPFFWMLLSAHIIGAKRWQI